MIVVNVGKASATLPILLSMKELTRERGSMDATSVGELSPTCLVKHKRTHTREKQVDSVKVEYSFQRVTAS